VQRAHRPDEAGEWTVLIPAAESLFSVGCSVERTDGLARILDTALPMLLGSPRQEQDVAWRTLLHVIGATRPATGPTTPAEVLSSLAVGRHEPASIAHAVGESREQALRARDAVPSELWECLNTTRARMPRKVADERMHEFFAWVRERSALAVGIVEASVHRDEVWSCFTLGRSIERADITTRILAARSFVDATERSWTTMLRSCGAYEPYLRTDRGASSTRSAAEFLLLDRRFPRSVAFSVRRAEECLRDIAAQGGPEGAEPCDEAADLLASISSGLESRPSIGTSSDELSERMQQMQRALARASGAIHRWFRASTPPERVVAAGPVPGT
jgi:uncharacterized alpha-E superfamily protein